MTYHNHSLWLVLIVVAVMFLMLGIGAPASAQAIGAPASEQAAKIPFTVEEKIKVRKEEERRSKIKDKSYSKQVKALAKQYKETAKLIDKDGGDPRQVEALLEAADYFDEQSKLGKKK